MAVSVHLISLDGKWMLWPIDPEETYGSKEWFETYIRGNFRDYKEYRVGAIFCQGQLGKLCHLSFANDTKHES